jgi:hypothetical protein
LGQTRSANNLNQIAKHLNQGTLILDETLEHDINVALADIAWIRILAGYCERLAKSEGNLIDFGDLGRVFPDPFTSFGDGLDVVAPSIGVTLTISENSVIDTKGILFACSMVIGLLAVALDKNQDYLSASGAERTSIAKSVLIKMSRDIGLINKFQGSGIPLLVSK